MDDKRSRGNRPNEGYRWPTNQNLRRMAVIENAEREDKALREASERLNNVFERVQRSLETGRPLTASEQVQIGADIAAARNLIAEARGLTNDSRIAMIEAKHGPEKPEV